MEVKILSPLWGHEHLPFIDFLDKIRLAGYDGFDMWLPDNENDKRLLYNYLQQYKMHIVTHQHSASGDTFAEFKRSFLKNLHSDAEPGPILINSHTGRDWFTFEQNLELLDIAQEFSYKTGILVAHETHRGRLGYSPQSTQQFFDARDEYYITADLSHWTCVTESMLENFAPTIQTAIKRTRHIHSRIGFENGPQVPDPRAPEWNYALQMFLELWDEMVAENERSGREIMTITTEFGPPPYMPVLPFSQQPVADQFAINCFMKDLLRERYQSEKA